jgi:hypothetical protein
VRLALTAFVVIACVQHAVGQAKATRIWTAPRTADGQPDIQGVWSNATITPIERPAELAAKQYFTEQEGIAYEKDIRERNNMDRRDGGAEADVGRAYNDFWWDRGTHIVSTRRTSLVIDPPDGKIPPLTPEAQKRLDVFNAETRLHPADGPENRRLSERCLVWATAGPPMLPGAYNNNYQIVQAPGYVMVFNEMIHDVRTISLDGRPHLPSNIRQWLGDSRGHWDGNTLVVDTTNFTDKTRFRGTGPNMHLVERFTRTGPNTLLYEFTVEDPAFTNPWTLQIPSTKTEGPIYEYACHEGNYGMAGILAGARADEAKKGSR